MEVARFKFEELIIWQKAMDFGEDIYKIALRFPKDEIYNLSSQIRRALNISEGSIGQSNLELKKFTGYSIRSLAEVITCVHKAKRRNYISQDEFNVLYDFSFNLMNMMIAFRSKVS
jgi:four helix bundle protein